jgi:hypothetical protein
MRWLLIVLAVASATAAPGVSSFAYVTFYYGGDSSAASLLSTRVLLSSLRRTGTEYPIVVVVPPSVPSIVHDVLTTEGALVTTMSSVVAPDLSASLSAQALTHFRNKLLLWTLTEYRRLVLLDHDDLGACPVSAGRRAGTCTTGGRRVTTPGMPLESIVRVACSGVASVGCSCMGSLAQP